MGLPANGGDWCQRAEMLAESILQRALQGMPPDWQQVDELIQLTMSEDPVVARTATRILFQVVAEGLADRFEPRLSDYYGQLFSHIFSVASKGKLRGDELYTYYQALQQPIPFDGSADRFYVLSRVTLGADVAITSTVLDGLHRYFPKAEVIFVGPKKNAQLFAGAGWLNFVEVNYPKNGSIVERLQCWLNLKQTIERLPGIVVDPDSRLTQLGLLPLGIPGQHVLFNSRSYGATEPASLYELTKRWLRETFGVETAKPFIAPVRLRARASEKLSCVSFGVGGNERKRVGLTFERAIVEELARRGYMVMLDGGGTREEINRARQCWAAVPSRLRSQVRIFHGSFASFACFIRLACLYVGYDSSGQHVAATCDVPLVVAFKGWVCRRMFQRWSPPARSDRFVLQVQPTWSEDEVVEAVVSAIDQLSRF